MKVTVTLSVLPDKREIFEVEAVSTAAAICDVMQRDMVAEALGRVPSASLVISAMKGTRGKGSGQ